MEKKEFKKALRNVLASYGFLYVNKAHYCRNDELIVVVATQKSNYSNAYYINYGFLIRELNPDVEFPKDYDCDVRGRFTFQKSEDQGTFHMEEDDIKILRESLKSEIENKILPALSDGVEKYYELYPDVLMAASLKTKEYLKNKLKQQNVFSISNRRLAIKLFLAPLWQKYRLCRCRFRDIRDRTQ